MQHVVGWYDVVVEYARSLQATIHFFLWQVQLHRQFADAVGNKFEINLEGVMCIVTYGYKNAEGTRIALNVFDSRGISKLGIVDGEGNEKIIELLNNRE